MTLSPSVILVTLEEVSGSANVFVSPKVFETFSPVVFSAPFFAVTGRV